MKSEITPRRNQPQTFWYFKGGFRWIKCFFLTIMSHWFPLYPLLMTFAIPVQSSTNWANKQTGSWSLCWIQINLPSGEKWPLNQLNLGTARDLFEGYDGTEKDSLMQTEIVLREKLETLKRLDDMILDFLLPHPRPSPCFWPSIAPLGTNSFLSPVFRCH